MKLFIGNIGYYTNQRDINLLFKPYGETILSIEMAIDKFTQRSKGYCHLEVRNTEEGNILIEKMNGFLLNGKTLIVKKAWV